MLREKIRPMDKVGLALDAAAAFAFIMAVMTGDIDRPKETLTYRAIKGAYYYLPTSIAKTNTELPTQAEELYRSIDTQISQPANGY